MREATRLGQWRLMYQPIVDLNSRRCVGAEALLRWQHPSRGLLLPAEFIALAESSGQIVPITRSVMQTVVRDLRWFGQRGRDIYVGINLVAEHFRSPQIVLDLLVAAYSQSVNGTRLLLEITERGHIDPDAEMPRAVMERLREHGFMLAIDDFGARDAGMVYLSRFPVSHIKVDKALVDSIERGVNSRRVVQGIAAMARSIGVVVVAEGVETEAQVRILAACGVQYAQGYVFARPLARAGLDAFIAAGGRAVQLAQ